MPMQSVNVPGFGKVSIAIREIRSIAAALYTDSGTEYDWANQVLSNRYGEKWSAFQDSLPYGILPRHRALAKVIALAGKEGRALFGTSHHKFDT